MLLFKPIRKEELRRALFGALHGAHHGMPLFVELSLDLLLSVTTGLKLRTLGNTTCCMYSL